MAKQKNALVTGITGQSGSYLVDLLLEMGYIVHGIIRRSSSINTSRIDHVYNHPDLHLHYGDVTDSLSITKIIKATQPDEIYNLAAQSHVKVSFETPEYTAQVDALGTLRILEACRLLGIENTVKIYQASTSELFGLVQEIPQKETTPFYPRSPYGVAKLYGFWIVKNYREAYNMFACSGILFNHESPRRGHNFVTQKIVQGLNNYRTTGTPILLGNLNALRDWGHAKDYVKAMWLMMQQDIPDDYVIATGEQYSVREFVETSGIHFDLDIRWNGAGLEEEGYDKQTGKTVIKVDPRYFRPSEVESLLGDPSKAKKELGWAPEYTFEKLVEEMCEYEKNR